MLIVLLATACVESAPQAAPELGPAQDVQALLDTRADALAAGDLEGFLAALDPPARAVEGPLADQAQAVPLAELRLRLREATFDRRDVDGAPVLVADNAKVDVVFRYEGLAEDNPFSFRLRSDFEQRDGAWRVADSQIVVPDTETPVPMPPMWASGPVAVARSEHFLALHRPGLAEPGRVLDLAEQARAQLVPQLTLEPAPTHVVQIAADDAEFAEIRNPAGPPRAIAVASYHYPEPDYARSRVPQSRHVSVNLAAVLAEQLPPEERADPGHDMADAPPDGGHEFEPDVTPVQVFQHELAHLALSRFTRPSTPVWVAEGGAMALAGEQRTGVWRRGLEADAFDDMTFLRLSRRDPGMGLTSAEYAYVNAAVSWLVDEFGVERFWAFYRDFKEFTQGSAGNPLEQVHADATHRLLFRLYDMGEEQLDERARQWMRAAV
ncbi:MAG: hypothetical protein WD250_07300 [Egibacteraceae bacterium]